MESRQCKKKPFPLEEIDEGWFTSKRWNELVSVIACESSVSDNYRLRDTR